MRVRGGVLTQLDMEEARARLREHRGAFVRSAEKYKEIKKKSTAGQFRFGKKEKNRTFKLEIMEYKVYFQKIRKRIDILRGSC